METTINPFVVSSTQYGHIVKYADGTKRIARLFYSSGGYLCEFNKGSRKYGHHIDLTNVVSIEPTNNNVDLVVKTRRFLKKVIATLEKTGLWANFLHDFKIVNGLNDDELLRFLEGGWSDEHIAWTKELGLIAGYQCGVDSLKYTVLKGIKTINYNSWDKPAMVQEFAKAIAEKRQWSLRWRKGYDNSVECKLNENTGVMMAWYAEEFKNCGNGHYYYAIDDKHAIFGEDD
jgi:hypothetical protein